MSKDTQIQKQIEEAVERFKEDNGTILDTIPEQFCSMCEHYEDWIVPNDEKESKEKYPWFCTNCEDASEIVNLREQLLDSIRQELSTIATKSAESAEDEAVKSVAKAYGKFHRIIDDQEGLYEWFRKAITTGFSQKEQQ